ncbi:MAG: ferrochelatase [Salinibacter sp.]
MTPLAFERLYGFDERVCEGSFYPSTPLQVEEGDRVGVVLLGIGGPRSLSDVESFLYNLYMDPVRVNLPMDGRLRHWLSAALARYRTPRVQSEYELIGGGTPMPRLAREQAECLQGHLQERYATPTGTDIRVYLGMRYGDPSCEEAWAQMQAEEVDKVVLVPLYPQYAQGTSGSVLAYWNALDAQATSAQKPTTSITEFAANPKYIQAVCERIDEGLQRFRDGREESVKLLFSAHGASRHETQDARDPFCYHVQATVEEIMRRRGDGRSAQIAFRETEGWGASMSPTTEEALSALAEEDTSALLVVPVSLVTDDIDTRYTLDIQARARAHSLGIERFEVASGLNTHPLLIDALVEAVGAQLDLPVDVNQLRVWGGGASQSYKLHPPDESPRLRLSDHLPGCPEIPPGLRPRQWRGEEERDPPSVRTEDASVADEHRRGEL